MPLAISKAYIRRRAAQQRRIVRELDRINYVEAAAHAQQQLDVCLAVLRSMQRAALQSTGPHRRR